MNRKSCRTTFFKTMLVAGPLFLPCQIGWTQTEPTGPIANPTAGQVLSADKLVTSESEKTTPSSATRAFAKDWKPPFPERREFFEPPKIEIQQAKQAAQQQVVKTTDADGKVKEETRPTVVLKGFVEIEDEPMRVVLDIGGKLKSLEAGETHDRVELAAVDFAAKTVTLKWGRFRWSTTLNEQPVSGKRDVSPMMPAMSMPSRMTSSNATKTLTSIQAPPSKLATGNAPKGDAGAVDNTQISSSGGLPFNPGNSSSVPSVGLVPGVPPALGGSGIPGSAGISGATVPGGGIGPPGGGMPSAGLIPMGLPVGAQSASASGLPTSGNGLPGGNGGLPGGSGGLPGGGSGLPGANGGIPGGGGGIPGGGAGIPGGGGGLPGGGSGLPGGGGGLPGGGGGLPGGGGSLPGGGAGLPGGGGGLPGGGGGLPGGGNSLPSGGGGMPGGGMPGGGAPGGGGVH